MPHILVTRALPAPGVSCLEEAFGKDAVIVYPEDRVIQRSALKLYGKKADGLPCMFAK